MNKGTCADCIYWEAAAQNCSIDGETTNAGNSCDQWVHYEDPKEVEKRQLADSYVPNKWDTWKKSALQKESRKNRNWEF